MSPIVLAEPLITTPGVYDMPAERYHHDPVAGGSISFSGLRKLLPPGCPARYRYDADHPQQRTTEALDHGLAAHSLVLGCGPPLVLVDRERWDTNQVKAQVAEIRAEGGLPLKRDDYEQIHAMAAALRADPVASVLLGGRGKPEQSLIWVDGDTGVWRRARIDWLPDPANVDSTRRLIVADYKTARSAEPDAFSRSAFEHGYHQQQAMYVDGIRAVHHDGDVAFVFVVQEKQPPYLVTVVQLSAIAEAIGRDANRRALTLYRRCVDTNTWPGYTTDVVTISLPAWVERRYLEDL